MFRGNFFEPIFPFFFVGDNRKTRTASEPLFLRSNQLGSHLNWWFRTQKNENSWISFKVHQNVDLSKTNGFPTVFIMKIKHNINKSWSINHVLIRRVFNSCCFVSQTFFIANFLFLNVFFTRKSIPTFHNTYLFYSPTIWKVPVVYDHRPHISLWHRHYISHSLVTKNYA